MNSENKIQFSFIGILIYLYLIQGLPYGIQARFIPIVLRQKGFSLSQVGIMKFLYIPSLLKTFYVPIIERHLMKKTWLRLSIIFLFFNCIYLALMTEFSPKFLILAFLMMNFFSSLQDVALDSLTLAMTQIPSEIIDGNVAQCVGYKIGSLFGGGVLLTLSDYVKWNYLFLFMSFFYMLGLVFTFLVPGFDCDSEYKLKDEISDDETNSNFFNMISAALSSRETLYTVIYLIIYKMGEQGASNMLPLFLIDNGIKVGHIGFWIGIGGQFISIIGSGLAGVFLTKRRSGFDAINCLCLTIAPLVTLLLPVVSLVQLPKIYMLIFAVILSNIIALISGILTTATFTVMMQCSQTRPVNMQSTHYTLIATFEILGKLLFTATIGFFTDRNGYIHSYILFASLSWMTCLFLFVAQKQFNFTSFHTPSVLNIRSDRSTYYDW